MHIVLDSGFETAEPLIEVMDLASFLVEVVPELLLRAHMR